MLNGRGGLGLRHIAIGTKNPTKVNAIKHAFDENDTIFSSMDVSSGVSEQPFSDAETIEGAINRARNSMNTSGADIGIGLEGGVEDSEYGLFLCNWGAIIDQHNKPIIAGGAKILLPSSIAIELKQGKELGEVMEEYTKVSDVRKGAGAIGVFTNGIVSRTVMFEHVAKLLAGQYFYQNI